jgi:DNA polymerase elongation subunit (family B)
MFGTKTIRKDFTTKKDYQNFLTMNKMRTWESDISPLYKFLSDTFYGSESTTLNVGYFDIEVDFDLADGQGYPLASNPFGEINSISLFDLSRKTYVLIALTDKNIVLSDDEFEVELYKCVTERQLLDTFFKVIEDIDILSAWHGDIFDIPYIMQRCKLLYGSEWLTKLCRNGYKAKEVDTFDKFGNPAITYELIGRVHLDLLELYRKFSFGEKPSFKLDNICAAEGVGRKIDYTGDLGELYRNDPQKFFEYSLRDSKLLYNLDKKVTYIDLAINMGRKASIRYTDVTGSIKYLEHAIRNYTHFDRDVVVVLPDKANNEREPFPGAFVVETKMGIYGWSTSIDLGSLYPSTIMAINISPETHILQCENNHNDFIKVVHQSIDDINITHVESGEEFTLKGFELYEMLRENGYTISAYGSIFSNEVGIIPEILTLWLSQRKEFKDKGMELSISGDSKMSEYYMMLSNLAKLSNNSLYGAISNPYSRFYTIYCAASTTLTGQMIERHQIYMADKIVEEDYNAEIHD